MFKSIHHWLATTDVPATADAIFVLAGEHGRKTYAAELFNRGFAPQVLLSTGRFELRRFANLELPHHVDMVKIAANIPPPLRHFFVEMTKQEFAMERIPAKGLGTLREMEALARWLEQRPGTKSLLIVSSASHLRRVRICCGALLPKSVEIRLLASPDENGFGEGANGSRDAVKWRTVLLELVKIVCYSVVLLPRNIGITRRARSGRRDVR